MTIIIPPDEQRCSKCSQCVEVTITGSQVDFDAPSFESECKDADCPINKNNQPSDVDKISICFVECSE